MLSIMIIVSFTLISCDVDDTESDYYSFKIISTGNDFTGWYSVDGGELTYITNELTINNSPYYSFSANLENPTYVRIHADGNNSSTTYIAIEIYENSVLVESAETSQVDGETISVTCDYTFNDTTTTD